MKTSLLKNFAVIPALLLKNRLARAALALSAFGFVSMRALAADIVLTEAFLNNVKGFVNFAANPLGKGSHTIPNNLQPGDTVYIQGHTRVSLNLVNLTQGSAENPITVTNAGGQFIIDNPDPAANVYGIKIWGAQHVHLRGTPGLGYAYGIKINRVNADPAGIEIDYNQFQRDDVKKSQLGVPSVFGNTVDLEISNVEIANTKFAGIKAKYEIGIAQIPAGYSALLDGLRIHDCYIHHTGGEGMYLGWTTDGHPDIANVSVYNNFLVDTGWDGIQLAKSQGVNEVFNNEIIGYGITSYTWKGELWYGWQNAALSMQEAWNLKVHHNYAKATRPHSGSAMGLEVYGTTNIYNNIFDLRAPAGSLTRGGMYIKQLRPNPTGTKITIANNTFIEPEENGIHFHREVALPAFITNNIIANLLSGKYIVNPTASTPVDTKNLFAATFAEVGFVSDNDFHLATGSPAIDTGAAVPFIVDDYDYNPRPSGAAFDKGAFEYQEQIDVGVVTPTGWGQATGSGYSSAAGAFDEQPTWNDTTGIPEGISANPHASTVTNYANRFWYIDFGPDWSQVRITQMWTRYRPNSPGSFSGFAALWWDDDIDTVNDDGIADTRMNFATAQNLPNDEKQLWIRDHDFGNVPVVPQGRYLVIGTGSNPTNRANEFVFIGYNNQ